MLFYISGVLEDFMKNKKLICMILVLCQLLSFQLVSAEQQLAIVNMDLTYNGSTHKYSASEVKIMIDNVELVPEDMPPIIINGSTMLPMRLIVEALGGEAVWNGDTRQVFAITDEYIGSFTIDSNESYRNEDVITMTAPAMIVNERTMLPVRGVADTLGLEVGWDDATRTVYIGEQPEKEEASEENTEDENEDELENDDLIEEGHSSEAEYTSVVEKLTLPSSNEGVQAFVISGDYSISDFEEVISEDPMKIIIDIFDSTTTLPSEYSNTNSDIVSSVRVGSHDDDGVPRTRVVFDLALENQPYEIFQNQDGKQIILSFGKLEISDISVEYTADDDRDTLKVTNSDKTNAKVSFFNDPSRVAIYISNVENGIEKEFDTTYLKYVKTVTSKMVTANTLEILMEIDDFAAYYVEDNAGVLSVVVYDSGLKNLFFNDETMALELSGQTPLDLSKIQINDMHSLGYYEIQFAENYMGDYGMGTIHIGNSKVESIDIEHNNNGTLIRFNQSTYNAYVVQEASMGYEIAVKNPQEVYDKIIMIDAGHGAHDGGTTGNGLVEKDLNLSVALKLEKYLDGSGIKVYQSRQTDTYPELVWRPQMASLIADVMVSIHHNAADSSTANGTETFYMVNTNEQNPTENQLTSQLLAQAVQDAVIKTLETTNRGIKIEPAYVVLNRSSIPTILAEIGFLTNVGDALKVGNDENQEKIAKNMADAIIDLFNNYDI